MSVYYVLAPDLGMVKIGYAEHVRNRFSKMQTDSPTRLVLVGIEDGAEDAEALLHQQFHAYRRRGEWFSVEGALEDHIAALAPIAPREKSLNAKIVAMGISKSHASLIINGKHPPSLSLAVAIWRATGWKCPRISHATDEQLAVIEQVEPWTPKAGDVAA